MTEVRDLWTRAKMAWAVLRGRSVMYRMTVDGDRGLGPKTLGAFMVDNYISLPNAGGRILLPPQGD